MCVYTVIFSPFFFHAQWGSCWEPGSLKGPCSRMLEVKCKQVEPLYYKVSPLHSHSLQLPYFMFLRLPLTHTVTHSHSHIILGLLHYRVPFGKCGFENIFVVHGQDKRQPNVFKFFIKSKMVCSWALCMSKTVQKYDHVNLLSSGVTF